MHLFIYPQFKTIMGNAIVSNDDGADADVLNQPINFTLKKKINTIENFSSAVVTQNNQNNNKQEDANGNIDDNVANIQQQTDDHKFAITHKDEIKINYSQQKEKEEWKLASLPEVVQVVAIEENETEEEMKPMQILFQFIPYYNQGDPANVDSIVRASLSSLSIEEIDSLDDYGNTLLILACQYKCEDLVRIMLNKGADPNAINYSGVCGLHHASYKESSSTAIATLLLKNGANPEVIEATYGCTPLHYCAGAGDLEFCKLLLSHGAQIATLDYYNYTCVDYARDAENLDVADVLQSRLDKYNNQNQVRNNMYLGSATSIASGIKKFDFPSPTARAPIPSEWGVPYIDPSSGSTYYVHSNTGETIWETDLRTRLQPPPPSYTPQNFNKSTPMSSTKAVPSVEGSTTMVGIAFQKNNDPSTQNTQNTQSNTQSTQSNNSIKEIVTTGAGVDPKLVIQAVRVKLIALFGRHDPSRLVEVESLIDRYKDQDIISLFKDLCNKYGLPTDNEIPFLQEKLREINPSHNNNNNNNSSNHNSALKTPKKPFPGLSVITDFDLGKSVPIASRGSHGNASTTHTNAGTGTASTTSLTHNPSNNQISSIEHVSTSHVNANSSNNNNANTMIDIATQQNLANEMRTKFETQLEEERTNFRNISSEKDGKISQLQSEIETLKREIIRFELDLSALQAKLDRSQMQGGEALNSLESQLVDVNSANNSLKEQLLQSNRELSYEKEKLHSLELTMEKLALGHEEMIAKETFEAENRARIQREKDSRHAKELQDLEIKINKIESKFKNDLSMAKKEFESLEGDLRKQHHAYQMGKEGEIERMNREMAEFKAKAAKEFSAAQMMAEDCRKVSEENIRRADAAEALQISMQNEIIEARSVQQFNAQLHKDILREQVARKRLHNEMEDLKGKIRVYVRVRPFSNSELERGSNEAVFKDGKLSVYVKSAGAQDKPESKKVYDFDQVFGGQEGNNQEDVFRDTKHLIMSVVDGYNVCIFAYGQTGAGKSYTMIGSSDIGTCLHDDGLFDANAGITPRAVSELFRLLNERNAQITFEVQVQMFQLYRDGLEDLLAGVDKKGNNIKKKKDDDEKPVLTGPLKITLAEHSPTGLVQVENAVIMNAENPADVMKIFAKGSSRRTTASTQMNAESSRSHLICSLIVKLTNRRSGQTSIGKLTLVDLAGSERVDKSGAVGETLKEAQSINKSLSALGDVISALTSGQSHVPYRNHPLTMLMSDSIGGNAKTLMFVNTSPADYNVPETNNSLGFASRCKDITNSVASNPAVQQAQLNALKKELTRLKKTGSGAGGAGAGGLSKPGVGGLARPV